MSDDAKATCFALLFTALLVLFVIANDQKQEFLNETDTTVNC